MMKRRLGRVRLLLTAMCVVAGLIMMLAQRGPSWNETVLSETTVGNVLLTEKRIELEDGRAFVVAKGTVEVPEVRHDPSSRRIEIGFWVLRGTSETRGAPTYMLPGGPGNSFIGAFDSDQTQTLIPLFQSVGDVVLVDLRGINQSTPNIAGAGSGLFSSYETKAEYLGRLTHAGRAGREKLVGEGFDLAGYNVIEAAADVVEIADALGHEKINLYGSSFGSHWALTTAKQYPDRVNQFLVDGVEGFDHTVDDSAAVADAVARIADETTSIWNDSHDAADPFEAMQRLYTMSERSPEDTFGLQPHDIAAILIDGQMLGHDYALGERSGMTAWASSIAAVLDGSGTERLPLYRMIASTMMGRSVADAAVGLFDCASWISAERLERLSANAYPGIPDDLAILTARCEGWGVEPLPEEFRAPFASEVRGLFVHGTYDVKTPYSNALELIPSFPNAVLVTVHGGSHEAMTETLDTDPTFARDIRAWFLGGKAPSDRTLPAIPFDACPACSVASMVTDLVAGDTE